MAPIRSTARGFTLVELLVVVIIVSAVAAIVLPHIRDRHLHAREAALRATLKVTRAAIDQYHRDTGLYPNNLAHLYSLTPPPTGTDAAGNIVPLIPARCRGPYIHTMPRDPVNNMGTFDYSNVAPHVGRVRSWSTRLGSDGLPYRDW
jgi:general secretion pathway protein G